MSGWRDRVPPPKSTVSDKEMASLRRRAGRRNPDEMRLGKSASKRALRDAKNFDNRNNN